MEDMELHEGIDSLEELKETELEEDLSTYLSNAEKDDFGRNKKKLASKKLNKLESSLMKTFVDPIDSDSRKRYIKRWIYGELSPNRTNK